MLNQIRRELGTFAKFLRKVGLDRRLFATTCLIMTLMYPGQNYFQTIVIHPGVVRSYNLPDLRAVSYPVRDATGAPETSARAVVIQDVDGKVVMHEKNADEMLLPASTTKIMTALVALDHYGLDERITIKNEDRAVGSTMELVKGEVLTVESILYGLLVESGNDAALALADNYPGGYEAFIAAMNRKAESLHLMQTVYKNVSGVESYGHVTTARDLAILATVAVENPVVSRMMQTKNIVVHDVSGQIAHPLVSTNELLGVIPGLLGLKTGWTERAGECLVSYVERDGRRVIVVVLGSTDRFGETTRLIDWVYNHHRWETIDL